MKTALRLCLVLAVALLLTASDGWGASPAPPAPRPPASAAGRLAPAGAWLARLLAAGSSFVPNARVLPPAAPSTQATVSGHRGCIDPNGSPCS